MSPTASSDVAGRATHRAGRPHRATPRHQRPRVYRGLRPTSPRLRQRLATAATLAILAAATVAAIAVYQLLGGT
jgi:hypothetical protein